MKFRGFPFKHVRQSHVIVGNVGSWWLRQSYEAVNLDTTALIALTSNLSHGQVPTKDPCCIDQCFWGHVFFGPRLVDFFAQNSGSIFSETQVGWSFDDPVLEQQAHRRFLPMWKKIGPFEWDTYRIPMGYEWGNKLNIYIYIEPKIPTIGSWYISEKGGKTRNIWPFKWGTSWWQSIGLVGTLSRDNPHCKVNSSIVKHFNSKVFGIPKTTNFSNLNFRIPMISHVISHLLMIFTLIVSWFLKKPGSQRQAVQETEERCFNRWWMPKMVKTETKNTKTINLLWSCRFSQYHQQSLEDT